MQSAVSQAKALPSVDVVMFSSELSDRQVQALLQAVQQTPLLQGAGLVVMSPTKTTLYSRYAVVGQGDDAAALKPAIEEARAKTGGLPLDEQTATTYAMRAAELLGKIALNRNPVYDLSAAEPTLLRALEDARPDLVKASAAVLAYVDSKQAQSGLLAKAAEEKTAEDIKITTFQDLGINAKRFGNRLSGEEVTTLTKAVEAAASPELKAAAAEARGSLNLPADEAATLIVGTGKPAATTQPAD